MYVYSVIFIAFGDYEYMKSASHRQTNREQAFVLASDVNANLNPETRPNFAKHINVCALVTRKDFLWLSYRHPRLAL